MLMKSTINPLDSQEAKPYKNNLEIEAMTNLITPYQSNNMKEFESIFQQNKNLLMSDPFIGEHISDLIKNVRVQVLLILVKSYRRIRLPFISAELNITEEDTENLVASCILDQLIEGRIDQVNRVLIITRDLHSREKKYEAIENYATQIDKIGKTVEQCLSVRDVL